MDQKLDDEFCSNKVSINETLYILALIIYTGYNIIATSELTFLKHFFSGNIINSFILILLILSMVNKKISKKNKKIIIMFLIIILIIIIKNSLINKIPIIYSFIFVIALYKKNLKKIIKYLFFTYSTLLIIIFIFSNLNIISNIKFYRPDESDKVRYALGMIHPNTFYIYYFVCISAYLYTQENITNLKRLIILLISYYIYNLTDSRTGFTMIICLIFIDYLLCKSYIINNKFFRVIIINLFSILTLISYFFTIFFNPMNPVFKFLDSVLSHRINLMKKFYDIYGINIWGNLVQYKSIENGIIVNEHMILDNTYMYLLIDMGIIFTVLICILYYKLLKQLFKMNLNKEISIIVIYIIFAFSERLTLLQYNFSILMFFYLINFNIKKRRYKLKI
ncbi:hypothetical protein [Paraclostridium sordellii]|uniref:hypothetical protein n=1 Tax=Paraclostridium sordellii TaxID=1505 RepID=UPI0030D17AC7